MLAGKRPLVYFWLAEFTDGTLLPQFDPATGKESPFSEVDRSRLRRIGWYPFSESYAAVCEEEATPTENKIYTVDLKTEDELIIARRNTRIAFEFHRCFVCGFCWQLANKSEPQVDLPVSDSVFVEKIPIKTEAGPTVITFLSAICHNCGYHDCNEIMIKNKKIKKFSASIVGETKYLLGVKGRPILALNEKGEAEIISYGVADQNRQ